MTGLEIKKEAERYIEEYIDDPDALVFINRCLNMIGDQAQIYEERWGDVTEVNEWIELPPTTTHVRKVEKIENGDRKLYFDYEDVDNRIRFLHPRQYYIFYRSLPTPLAGILDTPVVHPAFLSVLVTVLIALWKLKDDDENPDGIRHFQLFMELTLRVANSLTRVRTPNVVKVIR